MDKNIGNERMWPMYVRRKRKTVSREGSKGERCGRMKKRQRGRGRMKARSKSRWRIQGRQSGVCERQDRGERWMKMRKKWKLPHVVGN